LAEGSAFLRLLGGFQLFDAAGAAVSLTSRRARGLLALVYLEGEAGVLRERVCGLLWSDRAEDQARASLRQCLFELKTALGPLADELVEAGRERITLRPGALASDVARLREGLATPDDPAALSGLLGAGPLLDGLEIGGLFDDWLAQARAAFEATLAAAAAAGLAALERQARWADLRLLADACLRRDPLQEAVAAAAIRADLAAGQPAAAQRRFQAIRDRLAEELGVAPGPALLQAMASAPAADAPTLAQPPAQGPGAPRLAVLAFDNLSQGDDLDDFSDGLSVEILQTLTRALDLSVIARSSSFQLRGPDKTPPQVTARLGATHALDGSVRRSGGRVRVSVQLLDCATTRTLWSERYDRELSDAFALQDEIAAAVAAALKVAFAPAADPAPVDAIAYELYLRARVLEVEQTAGAQRVELLEAAVARAPRFAPAWAALAQARVSQARHGPRLHPFAELKAQALAAAETALSLDPNSGFTYAILSRLQPWGRYAEREALLSKALSLAPNDPAILALAGAFCNHVGRVEEALRHLRRAYELDPLYPLTADIYGAALGSADHPDGPALYASWRARWPEHLTFSLGHMNLLMIQRDWRTFDEVLPVALAAGGERPELKATLIMAKAIRDDDPELRPRLARRLTRSLEEHGTIPLHQVASAAALGLKEEVFEALEGASYGFMLQEDGMEPASVYNPGIIFDRHFCTELMTDVRFLDLCAKLGLCDYWAGGGAWPDCAPRLAPHYDFRAEALARAGLPAGAASARA
jgi:TolB-like protein